MKQTSFAQNRTSSGRNARSFFMQDMWHRAVAILVFALICTGAWAARYANVTTSVTPTGGGYAYISTSSTIGASTNAEQSGSSGANVKFYIKAEPLPGYTFVKWEIVSAEANAQIKDPASANTEISAQCHTTNNKTRYYTIQAVFKVEGSVDAGLVFYSGGTNGNYLNSSTKGTTSFDPKTCIWTGTSGGKFTNGSYYLRNESTVINNANASNCAIEDIESGTTGARMSLSNGGGYYLRYNNGWTRSNSTSQTGGRTVVFAVTKKTTAEVSTPPTITTDVAIFTAKGSKTYDHSSAAYTMGYNDYIFYNGAHHYWKSDDSEAITGNTKPTAETFTYTWSLSANAEGHVIVNSSTGEVTYSNYYTTDTNVTLTLTATSESGKVLTATKTITFESPKVDPTGITLTSGSTMTLYVGNTGTITYALTPNPCYNNVTFASDATTIAAVDGNGVVTGKAIGTAHITVQSKKIDKSNGPSATVTVTVMEKVATPVIKFTPQDDGETASTTITCSTEDAKIYYTTDGKTPTTSSTLYSGTFNVNNLDEVKAIATKDSQYFKDSEIASVTYSKHKMPTPEIVITNGLVSFTCSETDALFYYTINGSTPTTQSTQWNGEPFTPTINECTIKVIAVKASSLNSDVASRQYIVQSGISGTTVILNDYEDHNWTYYSGVDASVDGGNYNTNYKNIMYSPDPRNVKITYNGGGVDGASAVAISGISGENQNVMIYYETIEKTQIGETGNYAYHVIPNPFSKRPKKGDTYYGFGGWKLVSGGEYISEYSNGTTLPLEPTIHFTNLDNNYKPNCTSAEIVFEATWVKATVKVQNSLPTFTDGTYETNFWVINGNASADFTIKQNMTVTQMTPDGGATADYRATAVTRNIQFAPGDGVTPKLEWMTLNENNRFTPNGKNMFIGRGVTNSQSPSLYFLYANNNTTVNQVVRVESGKFGSIRHYNVKPTAVTSQVIYLGCDYDRAKGDNTKLEVTGNCVYSDNDVVDNEMTWATRTFIKSGDFCNPKNHDDADLHKGETAYYYMGKTSSSTKVKQGRRYLEVQGGLLTNTAGGSNSDNNKGDVMLQLRVKGGTFRGIVFGCARGNNTSGSRAFILTGGLIKGWITPGTNGTVDNAGKLDGYGYLYVGGNSAVDSNGDTRVWTHSAGGNVFGAGCGIDNQSTRISGANTMGTNTVIADNAYVERGVYGGGSFGYSEKVANVYITGGHVAGKNGGISATNNDNYDANVQGGVYGGSCQNKGGDVNIYMTGGLVETGVYGGSNTSGILSGSVKMVFVGGQVGTSTTSANIHGGGFGASTGVSGNVDLNIGLRNASTGDISGDAVIYGDVYGGSALGNVNGTKKTDTYHTNVTLSGGTINGSLYGGGLGNSSTAANVYGPVSVNVYGGSVLKTDETGANGSGAIYGCNNINGAPQDDVNIDIYGTDLPKDSTTYAIYAVFGGGNKADYSGEPVIVVHNCDNSIEYVYGGGNAADVKSTNVTIYGGDKIGNVFGGGNGQNGEANIVGGDTYVMIFGGTIGNVYGGSNTEGKIEGDLIVNISPAPEPDTEICPIIIDNVYGGGNKAASKAGMVSISYSSGCFGYDMQIGSVYGGANQADITEGDIELNITAGNIGNVFGGNNNSGEISGTITVNVDEERTGNCGLLVGNVYGAGNKADYTGSPEVYVKNGTVTGNVFGGGLSANVEGDTKVEVTGGNVLTAVYGGGALADVTGNTTVNLIGGTVNDVYGGGLGRNASGTEGQTGYLPAVAALVKGDTNVTLGKKNSNNKYSSSKVTGSIFGCNNINGTPTGHAKVTILKTTPRTDQENDEYDVAAVYGGGNQAAYIPTNKDDSTEVVVIGCDNSIEFVYGGGNAASTPATHVTINGGYMHYVFGGGNGAGEGNPGADIGYKDFTYDKDHEYGLGKTRVNIFGGTIDAVYGGSNTKGNIRVQANVYLEDMGLCELNVTDVYGAGNEAEMYGDGNLIIGCIPGLKEIYGGSKNADINGDVTLTITNGKFDKVFGGNNLGGNINGTVTVIVEETGCRPVIIGDLYGGGNLAAYTAPADKPNYPLVEVRSCTKIDRVFGGGLGVPADTLAKITDPTEKAEAKKKGVVTGNPHVNIGMVEGDWKDGWTDGEEVIPAIDNKVWGNQLGTIGVVYGGGDAADTVGDTYVNIGTNAKVTLSTGTKKGVEQDMLGVNISGNVYGGGNQANVTGKTNVVIGR